MDLILDKKKTPKPVPIPIDEMDPAQTMFGGDYDQTLEKSRAKAIDTVYEKGPKDSKILDTITDVDNFDIAALTSIEVINKKVKSPAAQTFLDSAKRLKISLGRRSREEVVRITSPREEAPMMPQGGIRLPLIGRIGGH